MTNTLTLSPLRPPTWRCQKVFSTAIDRCRPTVALERRGDQTLERQVAEGAGPATSTKNYRKINTLIDPRRAA